MSVTELAYQKASAEDAPVIFSLCKTLIDTYEDCASIDYDHVIKWVEQKISKHIEAYTCVMLNGKKVGYFHLEQSAGEAQLDDLYILPEYRGKGIGTTVISHCIEKTKTPIFLYVFKKNVGAIQLYRRMGFVVSQEVGNTRLIMLREVDNNR